MEGARHVPWQLDRQAISPSRRYGSEHRLQFATSLQETGLIVTPGSEEQQTLADDGGQFAATQITQSKLQSLSIVRLMNLGSVAQLIIRNALTTTTRRTQWPP